MKHINIALFIPDEGCPHRCSFCNQKTITGTGKRPQPGDVISACETALNGKKDVSGGEIAFFGGSFTAIERGYMLSLLKCAKSYLDRGLFKGIRISTRPDCIDDSILALLKEYKVTSIELGCQSMDDEVLFLNERGHTAAQCESACRLVREYGFELGVQMMTGLFGDTDEKALKTAQRLIALRPDTVRIYPTVVLKNTALERLYAEGRYRAQTLEEAVALCSRLLKMFTQGGVKVIRLGLHSGGGVEENYVAGAYHPAFREKCESRLYRENIEKLLSENRVQKGEATVFVSPRYLSQAKGQKKENITYFKEHGYNINIVTKENIEQYEVRLGRSLPGRTESGEGRTR